MPWIKWCDRLWRVFSASLSECLQIIARCSLLPQTASFVLITWSRHCQLHRLRLTGESALQELVLLGLHRFQGGDSSQTRGYNRCCTLTTKLLALSQSIRCFRDDCRSFEPIHNRTLDILDIGIQVCINQNQNWKHKLFVQLLTVFLFSMLFVHFVHFAIFFGIPLTNSTLDFT